MAGWADFGAALAGNPVGNAAAFDKGVMSSTSRERALMAARKDREEALARENIRTSLDALMPEATPEQRDAVANLTLAGKAGEFSQSQQGIGYGYKNRGMNEQLAVLDALKGGAPATDQNMNLFSAGGRIGEALSGTNINIVTAADAAAAENEAQAASAAATAALRGEQILTQKTTRNSIASRASDTTRLTDARVKALEGKGQKDISVDPAATKIKADLKAGKITLEEAARRLKQMGYD